MDPKTLLKVGDVVTFVTLDEAIDMYGLKDSYDDVDNSEFRYVDFPEDDDYHLSVDEEELKIIGGHTAIVTDAIHFSGHYHYHYIVELDNGMKRQPVCPSMLSPANGIGSGTEELPEADTDSLLGFLFGEKAGV